MVHDEIDLPFGEVRSRLGGGLAGHNGLKSLAHGLGGRTSGGCGWASGGPTRPTPRSSPPTSCRASPSPRRRCASWCGRAADETERLVRELGEESRGVISDADHLRRGRGGVALLRLDRPEARNAMNTQMLEEMLGHLATARDDDERPGLVLSSTDHMGLSAGADVREQLDAEGRVRRMELFARLYDELTGFPKPTVAACHGSCVGGGAEIAVACDLRVGGSNLRLRFPGGGARRPGGAGAPGRPSAGSRWPSICS